MVINLVNHRLMDHLRFSNLKLNILRNDGYFKCTIGCQYLVVELTKPIFKISIRVVMVVTCMICKTI